MTIDEALRLYPIILQRLRGLLALSETETLALGFEALRSYKRLRLKGLLACRELLPGEAKE